MLVFEEEVVVLLDMFFRGEMKDMCFMVVEFGVMDLFL